MSISNRSYGLTKGHSTGFAALLLLGAMASNASAGSLIVKDNFKIYSPWLAAGLPNKGKSLRNLGVSK